MKAVLSLYKDSKLGTNPFVAANGILSSCAQEYRTISDIL